MKLFSLATAAAVLCCSGTVASAGIFGCHDSGPTCAAPCAPTCAAPCEVAYSGCDTGCTGYAAPAYTSYCCPPEKKGLCERLFGGMKGGMQRMGGLFSCCHKEEDTCCYAAPSCCAPVTCAAPCGEVVSGCGDVCGAAPTCAAPCATSCAPVTCAAPVAACGDACGNGGAYAAPTCAAPTCAAPCGCN